MTVTMSGLGIRLSVFRAVCLFFVSERAKEQFAHQKEQISSGRSFVMSNLSKSLLVTFLFVKSDVSKSLKLLFKKERISKEQGEWFALRHKKGKNCQKHKKIRIFERFTCFLLAICSNHEQSLTSLFFKEQLERFSHIELLKRMTPANRSR